MDLYAYLKVIPQEIPTDMHVIVNKNCHTELPYTKQTTVVLKILVSMDVRVSLHFIDICDLQLRILSLSRVHNNHLTLLLMSFF